MVNPGAFTGSRRDFLLSEKPAYALAVEKKYVQEALSNIQRRFFKRYPVDLPEEQEPTAAFLAAVDDDAPEPEIQEPNADTMSEQDYQLAVTRLNERRAIVKARKAQIKRWMVYQYNKDHNLAKDTNTPWGAFMARLTGQQIQRPRLKTGVNIWRKELAQRNAIEAEYEAQSAAASIPFKASNLAADRDRIARALFAQLPQEEKELWKKRGRDQHDTAMARYNAELHAEPSSEPEDRQRSIQGLTQFMQPLLDMVCKATGWNATLIAGGPEPAHSGHLNVISVHLGVTPGTVKMNFGHSEREAYKTHIIPVFGSFLKKCYSPEECRARAIPQATTEGAKDDDDINPLSPEDFPAGGATLHTISLLPSTSSSAGPLNSLQEIENARVPALPSINNTVNGSQTPVAVAGSLSPLRQDQDDTNHFPYSFSPAQFSAAGSRYGSPGVSAPPSPTFSRDHSPRIRPKSRIATDAVQASSSSTTLLPPLPMVQAATATLSPSLPTVQTAATSPSSLPTVQAQASTSAPVGKRKKSSSAAESGKKRKKPSSSAPVARPQRRLSAPVAQSTQSATSKRKKPGFFYLDDAGNHVDKYGVHIDEEGNPITIE